MYRRLWQFFRSRPARAALALSALLAAVNVALLVGASSKRSAAAELALAVEESQASLSLLQQVEMEGLQELEGQAEAAESELKALKASFPSLGDAFDMYRRAFALAEQSAVEIVSIETGSSSLEQTPVGYLSKTSYSLKGLGGYADCIDLMARLETAGLQTLALDALQMDALHCEFDVILASSVPASQVDPVEAVGDG